MEGSRYILASASPRRRELLAKILKDFTVVPSRAEERIGPGKSPADIVMGNALMKALEVSAEYPDVVVIAADTIVVLGEIIIGKPAGPDEATDTLRALSGRTHQVITGVAIVLGDPEIKLMDSRISNVTFRHLDIGEIQKYVREKNPLDKAGAYGIQEVMDSFVEHLDGDLDNVIGLPTNLVAGMLHNMNMSNFR